MTDDPRWRVLAGLGAVILIALVLVIRNLPARACCYRYWSEPQWKRGLHLGEWHHGWLVVLACVPWWPVQVAGLLAGVDDLVQHWIQTSDPGSRKSVLHWLADKAGVI